MNTEIIEKYWERIQADNKTFEFNLQSNGRLSKPMKFEMKDSENGGYMLYNKTWIGGLIELGDLKLKKQQSDYQSCYCQHNDKFHYHGIEKALCGKQYFTLKRIVVIQMK